MPALLADGTSLDAAFRALRDAFRAAGLDAPDLDARILVGHAAGLDLTGLVREGARPLTAAEGDALALYAARRIAREPVARILGRRAFWGHDFDLSADTLVPRPDTETLVETVLRRVDAAGRRDDALMVADIGTGTGAILAALLGEWPRGRGLATDISAGALVTARANLARLGLAPRCALVRASYAQALAPGRFDVIVSNPPYIGSAEIAGLDPEVARHDPRAALDGGADGLDAYRDLVPGAIAPLVPGGLLAVEIGATQAEAVTEIFRRAGFGEVETRPDLAGRPRVVVARKHL